MKTTFKIAKAELQVLFYSPVAWLILVIFTFQAGVLFTGLFDVSVRKYLLGSPQGNLTMFTFYGNGYRGFFLLVQKYLYLYIPLLTMGIMSREFASGSIKLLFSSPVTNRQIILGKYLALVVYGLVLVGILGIYSTYAAITIDQVDIPPILNGLLGIFLLLCAYSAIGLFMSSITSYTVVAAMGTLAVFAILNYVKNLWQDIEMVRDVTYWLAITGRSDNMITGLLTSEDVIYFLVVISLFLMLSIIKLQGSRQRTAWYITYGKYTAVLLCAALIGYFTSLPEYRGFYDTTRTKMNTLTESSQEVVSKLDGGLTITTYVNMLEPNFHQGVPTLQKFDIDRFKQYTRFKPDIKLRYKYYYHRADNPELDVRYPGIPDKQRLDSLNKVYNWNFPIVPYEEIKDEVDLSGENYRFVRLLERENGQRTFLRIFNDLPRFPSETEITAAFKRLVMDLPVVGFTTGHGERHSRDDEDRGYNMFANEKTFRYALINQGFDFVDLSLSNEIPEEIRILVVADMRKPLNEKELGVLNRYIERGGNLIIAAEPGREEVNNALTRQIGVRFLPGMLVGPTRQEAEERVDAAKSGISITIGGSSQPLREDTLKIEKPKRPSHTNLLLLPPAAGADTFSHHVAAAARGGKVLTMPTAAVMELDSSSVFRKQVLFETDPSSSWNEVETTNFVDDTVRYNPAAGEVKAAYPAMVALSRNVGDKEQRILVTADADWLSNGELGLGRKGVKSGNFDMIMASFYWLSDGEVPIDMRRDTPPDKRMSVGKTEWKVVKFGLKWVLPVVLVLFGTIIWLRRRGR